jgi:phosphonate transport system permease protein
MNAALPRVLTLLAVVLLVIASFATLSLEWRSFLEPGTSARMLEFVQGFAPPQTAPAFVYKTSVAALETLAMSLVGTLLAAIAGLLLALPASSRTPRWIPRTARAACRTMLNFLRAIPELVWAAMTVIAAGLGPFAGVMALALHTTGVLGRLFAETIENAPPAPAFALQANGASRPASFLYGTLPAVSPQLLSYTLYRWENNIRAAAVLGVVGAGGLGQMLKFHLGLFQMPEAATVILAMIGLVALVDAASFQARRVMAS